MGKETKKEDIINTASLEDSIENIKRVLIQEEKAIINSVNECLVLANKEDYTTEEINKIEFYYRELSSLYFIMDGVKDLKNIVDVCLRRVVSILDLRK